MPIAVPKLPQLKQKITDIRKRLQLKFDKPSEPVELGHFQLSNEVFLFETNKSGANKTTEEQKIDLLMHVNHNLQEFLNKFMKAKLIAISSNNPHSLVQQISVLWSHYQKLIYCYSFIFEKMKMFCFNFYKVASKYSKTLKDQIIGPIPVMGAFKLKKFIDHDFKQLVRNFSDLFCNFICEQRSQRDVPRQLIKESLSFFESCYLNYQAHIQRQPETNRIKLVRKPNKQLPANLRSTDQNFFQQNFLGKLLDSTYFYNIFVREKALKLTSTEQITEMKKIIIEEQQRSFEYIRSDKNRHQYLKKVNEVLIIQGINSRIYRTDGLSHYLKSYVPSQLGKSAEFQQQIKNFWFVYSRVLDTSLEHIKNIYLEYLKVEGEGIRIKMERFRQFTQQMIRVNRKNNDILEIMSKNFQLKNLYKNTISKMLSNTLIEDKATSSVNFRGAKNLALYTDMKFRSLYHKPNQHQLQVDTFNDIISVFKILTEKDSFLKEHQKFTAYRLQQELDFSKDQEYACIHDLENKLINEIRNQMGFLQVKYLNEYLKDVTKSEDMTKIVKEQLAIKFCKFNQILIKSLTFWPDMTSYQIENPPNLLIGTMHAVRDIIIKKGDIKYELTNGVSLFKGNFKNTNQQIFNLKNVYLIILLFIDQQPNKRIYYGDLKMKMKRSIAKKSKHNNDLQRNLIELLYSGLLKSNKQLKDGDLDVAKIVQSDFFQINQSYNFVQEQKRQKKDPKKIKPLRIISNPHISQLPAWLEKALRQAINSQQIQEKQYETLKRNKIKGQVRKMLKHAHNQNRYCSFQDFMKNCSKLKQYPVNYRYMKQIIQNLINQGICERVQEEKNTYRYIA